ncbi:MAG: tripartite tricarboxylate transporter substrate binding protein [Beijerinckiaceae bacterium]|jgi:tripartite-type tricarboxylate transporter receptor subunit TctC|nr:tripartite tricarboxylate transporter substrate binding protein [Beijerinckiaceae bacterium]
MRRMNRRQFGVMMTTAAVGLASGGGARAAWQPRNNVKVIVPFAAGGATDVLARIVGDRLTQIWGQPVIIENVSGATGAIGATQAARANPDGLTLFVGTGSVNSALPSVKSDLSFDTLRDFKAVSLLATFPNVLVVRPGLPVKDVPELIAYLKQRKGGVNFASSGFGSSIHLAGELFKLQTGTQMTHVPYRGSAPALTDLLAGHVDLMFDNLTNVMPHIESGKIKALGVAGASRTPYLPAVPAISEFVPGFEATTWVGYLAPAKTPDEIVDQIAADCDGVLREPAIVERIKKLAAEPVGGTPARFAQYLKADVERWKKLVKDANLQVE